MVLAPGALLGVGVGLTVWVIVASYSPVPFADFWGEFPFLERALGGDVRLADLWAQANEHRIFLPRLQFLLDYSLFDGTYVFLFVVISLSCLLIACALSAIVWRETHEWLTTWVFFAAATIAMLSPAATENLTWAFQVGFVQVFLFGTVAILAVVLAARTGPGTRPQQLWTAAAVLGALAATYSLANGLLLWPLLAVIALALGLSYRSTVLLAGVGLAAIFSYLWHFNSSAGPESYSANLKQPAGMLKYAAVYLGSALRPLGVYPAAFAGATGLGLFVLLCVLAWRERSGRSVTSPAGAGLAMFVVLTAGVTALGRVNLGLTQALSSRYATASALFWLGLLLGFLRPVLDHVRLLVRVSGTEREIGLWVYLGAAVLVAFGVSVAAFPDRSSIRESAIAKELAVLSFRAGVVDRGALTGVSPFEPLVESSFRWLEDKRLGPWAPGGMVDSSRFTLQRVRVQTRCSGRVESVEPVPGGLRLEGWIASAGGASTSHQLAVVDGSGEQRGLGIVGTHRHDVKTSGAASSDWTGFVAYARGRPAPPLGIVIVGADHRNAVCRLETAAEY
jgi:hypothetical protein